MLKPLPGAGNRRHRENVRPRPGLHGKHQRIGTGQLKRGWVGLHSLGWQVKYIGLSGQGDQQVGSAN